MFTSLISQRRLQMALCLAIGMFLLSTLVSGAFYWYLSERLLWLTIVATILFLAIPVILLAGEWASGAQATAHVHQSDDSAHSHDHVHGQAQNEGQPPFNGMRLALLALPLVVGVLVPGRPLSASAVANKELNSTAALAVSNNTQPASLASTPAAELTILDWVRETNTASDLTPFAGQNADVVGFVDHDQRLASGQFLVGRYAITHCIAEAVAVGMVVDWQPASPPDDTWVRVHGPVTVVLLDGRPVPKITAVSVEVVPQPARPYLYP